MHHTLHKITVILFLILITLPSFAQIGKQRQNLSVGVNAGVNFNSVSFTPTIKQKSLTGFAGGLTARYISEKYFAMICGIQAELNFVQRGWEEDFENLDVSNPVSYSRTMNYLEIPLLAHLAFGKERGMQFFVNLGPQVAYLISESENKSNPFNPTGVHTHQYGKTVDNKFDYGIVGGLGVELRTKAGNFLLEGRYYFGLADFYGNSRKDYFARSAHTTIMGRLTYLFDLKK